MQSVHRDVGAGLYRLPARVTTGRIREGSLIGLLCSRNVHDERGGMTPVVIPCSRSRGEGNGHISSTVLALQLSRSLGDHI